MKAELSSDPYNVVITGVGGQGNVMASRVLGNMLSRRGLHVTIGETFGASQRGGSVMSHLRISAESGWSPQIPRGKAHLVLALEPSEAIRVLADYGNPHIKTICNIRPIHSPGVISGEQSYPALENIRKWVGQLSETAWFVNATDAAMKLGHPIFGNIILIGALAAIAVLPLEREDFKGVIARTLPAEKVATNLAAYDTGTEMVSEN